MKIFDQHVHSNFSTDSKEPMDKYLKVVGNDFITTEHLEFGDTQEHDLDYTGYVTEIEKLKKTTGKHIYKGIEIGMVPGYGDKIKDYMAHHQFDLKLLAFHYNEDAVDFADDLISLQDPLKVTKKYFQLMWEGLQDFHDADVLAHFDYGIRRLNLTSGQLSTTSGVMLTDIFKFAIKHDIAFEVNTSSMYDFHNVALYEYAIEIYKQLGGKLFTIGSDAHNRRDYEKDFKQAINFMKIHEIFNVQVFTDKGAQNVAI